MQMEVIRNLQVAMRRDMMSICLILLLGLSWCCEATELMFELPDRDRQCFYEDIDKGTSSTLEYQVSHPIFMSLEQFWKLAE